MNKVVESVEAALADVHESIDEMAHYREHFLRLEA